MKRLCMVSLIGLLGCLDVKASQENYVKSRVTSAKTLRASFDELVDVGYMRQFKRWVGYENTNESLEQQRLEQELVKIKKENKIDAFIVRVQRLQEKIAESLHAMKVDSTHIPSIRFHDDGTVTIDGDNYTFAETVFADNNGDLEKIETMVKQRAALRL